MQPTLQERDVTFRSSGAEHLHKLFGILLHGRYISSTSFICSIIGLHQNRLIDIYFSFYNNPVVRYLFFVQIVPALVTGSSVGWLLYSFDLLPSLILLWTLLTLLHSCVSCLSPRTSDFSKYCWFLLLENRIRNQDWVLGVLTATVCSCF